MALLFTCFTTRHPKSMALSSSSVGCRSVTTFRSSTVVTWMSRSWTRNDSAPVLRTSHATAVKDSSTSAADAGFSSSANSLGLVGKVRSDDHFTENLRNRLGARAVERLIDSDDTTEGRLIIRSKRLVPRLAQVSALAHAAGVGMLEDRQVGTSSRNSQIKFPPPWRRECCCTTAPCRAVVQSTRQIYRTTRRVDVGSHRSAAFELGRLHE